MNAQLNRRAFLGAAAGSAAAVALPTSPVYGAARTDRRSRDWRVALNTIQWIATEDGWINPALLPPLDELAPFIASTGFDGIHPDIPAGMSVRQFVALLRENGLRPSSGYQSFRLPEDGHPVATSLENARVAAARHAEMRLDTIFIAGAMIRTAPRVAQPARGALFDQGRLDRLTELFGQIATVILAEGVRPALHQHVGTWIETEYELRYLLDNLGPRPLDFGPDVGHLTWAGVDPVAIISRYRDRVAGVHVKDVRVDIAAAARTGTWSYLESVVNGVWIEPGRGDVDLHAVFEALGRRFRGWVIVENDRPDLPVYESAVWSGYWMNANLPGRKPRPCGGKAAGRRD
jgi:inosose dehydratase